MPLDEGLVVPLPKSATSTVAPTLTVRARPLDWKQLQDYVKVHFNQTFSCHRAEIAAESLVWLCGSCICCFLFFSFEQAGVATAASQTVIALPAGQGSVVMLGKVEDETWIKKAVELVRSSD